MTVSKKLIHKVYRYFRYRMFSFFRKNTQKYIEIFAFNLFGLQILRIFLF